MLKDLVENMNIVKKAIVILKELEVERRTSENVSLWIIVPEPKTLLSWYRQFLKQYRSQKKKKSLWLKTRQWKLFDGSTKRD